ncbi:MAG: AAA family ATPase [Methyloligellaceae bacterium]
MSDTAAKEQDEPKEETSEQRVPEQSAEISDNIPVKEYEAQIPPIPRVSIQAFCEQQITADVLQVVSEDRRLAKAHVNVQLGGAKAALSFYQNAPTPNLIILEILQEQNTILHELDRLAEVCDSGTRVIVIGSVNDILMYRELLRRGVSEYLVSPVSPMQVMESISSFYNDPETSPVGQVMAFIGAKGGSGSSSVCHNTAWLITEAIQSDVVIADMDLPFGTAGLDFNQDPVQGVFDALSAPERLDAVLLDRLLSKCSERLSLFSAPGTLDREYDIEASSCDIMLDVVRQNVPYVMLDLPHMWTSWTKEVLFQADEIVITAEPDLASLRNAKNLVDVLKGERKNDRPPCLVLNQVNMPKRPEISSKDFANAVELEPSVVIDFDAELFGTASNNGQMIDEISKKSKASDQFRTLAFLLTHRTDQKTETKSSMFAPLLSKLNRKKNSK